MADVFISYSRVDQLFVRRLHELIVSHEKATWVDWEDIPLTAEWWHEIQSGIVAAQAVIFVISDDSLSSQVCKQELDYAFEQKKRIIPVVCREATERSAPDQLKKLNWTFMRNDEEFNDKINDLLNAIDTDLEWTRSHTRLLVRASEWESERDESLILRGKDLQIAEQWLLQASLHKEPQPTALQTEYIIASRNNAIKRHRLILSSVFMVLIIVSVLALIAVKQRNLAREKQKLAEDRELIALSRQLAAQSANDMNRNIPRGLLLALEAPHIKRTSEANQSLLNTLANIDQTMVFLDGHKEKSTVNSIAFSPDGKLLATAGSDHTIVLWDMVSYQPIGKPFLGHQAEVTGITFSPDGKLLASVDKNKLIYYWDPFSHKEVRKHPHEEHALGYTSIHFNLTGDRLVTADDNSIELWDGLTLASKGEIDYTMYHLTMLMDIALSPNGKLLASIDWDKELNFYEIPWVTPRPLGNPWRSFHNHTLSRSIAFSPDGKILAIAGADGTVTFFDVSGQKQLGEPLQAHDRAVNKVTYSADGAMLATASSDQTVKLWDVQNHSQIGTTIRGFNAPLYDVAFSPDGKKIALSGDDHKVLVVALPLQSLLAVPFKGHDEPVSIVAFNHTGTKIASASTGKSVKIWDNADPNNIVVSLPAQDRPIIHIGFSSSDHQLLIATQGVPGRHQYHPISIRKWDVNCQTFVGSAFNLTGGGLDTGKFNPEASIFAVPSYNSISLWDTQTERLIYSLELAESVESYLDFSSDGKILSIIRKNNTVLFLDIESHNLQKISVKLAQDRAITAGRFSPNGKKFAITLDDNTIVLWDLGNHRSLGVLEGHTAAILKVAFSPDPDDGILASAGADSSIILWDLNNLEALGEPLRYSKAIVRDLMFSPDGKTLAIASDDKTVRVINVDKKSWRQIACSIANRNLSQQEWVKYFGSSQKYHLMCNIP